MGLTVSERRLTLSWLGLLVISLLIWAAIETLVASLAAQGPRYTYEQVTVSTTAIGVSATTLSGMGVCRLALDATNGARYRADGTAPTSTVGVPLLGSGTLEGLEVRELAAMRFIRSGGSDAILNVACRTY